jgi:hypothetical protein
MTSRIRFTDAADVFETFPGLEPYSVKPAAPIAPLDHARALIASPRPTTALAFLAHLLPRRESVWWGCQCVSAMLGAEANDEGMRLATAWVRDPDEAARRDALTFAQASDMRAPTAWLARAVGYSGGSLLDPEHPPSKPPPEACALAVNAAIVFAATAKPPPAILPWMRACADAGARFASGDEILVKAPSVAAMASPR